MLIVVGVCDVLNSTPTRENTGHDTDTGLRVALLMLAFSTHVATASTMAFSVASAVSVVATGALCSWRCGIMAALRWSCGC